MKAGGKVEAKKKKTVKKKTIKKSKKDGIAIRGKTKCKMR